MSIHYYNFSVKKVQKSKPRKIFLPTVKAFHHIIQIMWFFSLHNTDYVVMTLFDMKKQAWCALIQRALPYSDKSKGGSRTIFGSETVSKNQKEEVF